MRLWPSLHNLSRITARVMEACRDEIRLEHSRFRTNLDTIINRTTGQNLLLRVATKTEANVILSSNSNNMLIMDSLRQRDRQLFEVSSRSRVLLDLHQLEG